jgi:hypothetical protein
MSKRENDATPTGEPNTKKLCFVVSPIGAEESEDRVHADWVLEEIIKPEIAELSDFAVKRADEDKRPGQIDSHLINDLHNAELVIADLSLRNPNVFYEVGIRHMLQLPIVHMQLASERPVFDVAGFRAVKFSIKRVQDLRAARSELRAHIRHALDPANRIINPISNARGSFEIAQNGTPELKLIQEEIRELRQAVAEVVDEKKRAEVLSMIDKTFVPNGQGKITATTLRDALTAITEISRGQVASTVIKTVGP